jgi:ABC-type glycerol-3-phosphate transport system substrate-binding protein
MGMKFRLFAMVALVAAMGTVACSDDPASVGAGDPELIVTTRSQTSVARNTPFTVTAFTIDASNRRVPGVLEANAAGPAVAIDSVRYVPELSETRVFARGTAATTGTDITFRGHGLTATTTVIVN